MDVASAYPPGVATLPAAVMVVVRTVLDSPQLTRLKQLRHAALYSVPVHATDGSQAFPESINAGAPSVPSAWTNRPHAESSSSQTTKKSVPSDATPDALSLEAETAMGMPEASRTVPDGSTRVPYTST